MKGRGRKKKHDNKFLLLWVSDTASFAKTVLSAKCHSQVKPHYL